MNKMKTYEQTQHHQPQQLLLQNQTLKNPHFRRLKDGEVGEFTSDYVS